MENTIKTGDNVYVHHSAVLMGNVTLGDSVNIWPGAVLRGDLRPITVGEMTNIQEHVTIHVDYEAPTKIGSHVTIGHGAIVHGCTIKDNALIGMGAIIMDGAIIGKNCIVGAGALVPQNTVVQDGSVVVGNPAKVVRPVRPEEIQGIEESARNYYQQAMIEMATEAEGID